MILRHFEVKTGKNKGYYIVTKNKLLEKPRNYKLMASVWGILPYEYNSGFYTRHRINPLTEIVWTHSRFAGNSINKREYIQLVQHFKHPQNILA